MRKITGLKPRLWRVKSYKFAQRIQRSPAIWLISAIVIFGAGFWVLNYYQPTQADSDTQTVRPDGDFGTTNNFASNSGSSDTSCTGGTKCDYIDEADDAEYLATGTGMDSTTAEEEYNFGDISVSGTLDQVTQVAVTVRAGIATQGSDADSIQVRLFIDGAYNGTTNSATLSTSTTDHTFTWSSLTATTASDLRVEVVRVVNGGGTPSGRDDDVRVYEVKADVTYDYTPPLAATPYLTLDGYVFNNDNSNYSESNSDYQFPTSASNVDTGKADWSSPGNVAASDDTRATVSLINPGNALFDSSDRLNAVDFDFQIPNDATILGVEVRAETCRSTGTHDGRFRLIINGSLTGDSNSGAISATCPADSSISEGSSNDMWGTSLSPNDVNAANFGISYSVLVHGSGIGGGTEVSEIDSIEMRITYSSGEPEPISAGSEFSTGKTLTQVRQGERIGLRTHLTNSGGALNSTDELALFYDRNDGVWSKVQQYPNTESEGDCDDNFGGNGEFNCEVLVSNTTGLNLIGDHIDMAINPINGDIWVSFVEFGAIGADDPDAWVARYVGSGGNCDQLDVGTTGSDAWYCYKVIADRNTGDDSIWFDSSTSIAIGSDGKPWVSFYERGNGDSCFSDECSLWVAEYVGSGGNCETYGGTSDAWDCTLAADYPFGTTQGAIGGSNSIGIDNNNNPWISATTVDTLVVLEYVGSSGNCDEDYGGSDVWECTLVATDSGILEGPGVNNRITFDSQNRPWVSHSDEDISCTSAGTGRDCDLWVSQFVGSGGNCDDDHGGSDAWECTLIAAHGTNSGSSSSVGSTSSIAVSNNGNVWITFYDQGDINCDSSTECDLWIAEYVESGGNCDDDNGGSDAWNCTLVAAHAGTSTDNVGEYHDLGVNVNGDPVISFYDGGDGTCDTSGECDLWIAEYVESGGNCDDDNGGSDAWNCTLVAAHAGTSTDNVGTYNALGFDKLGNLSVVFKDETADDVVVARRNTRGGDIIVTPSFSYTNGTNITTTYADMTASTDTSNRDDNDCLTVGASWNNGVYFGGEHGTGLSIPNGETTAQCTELSWTIDTSQAVPGATYRFIVATNDGFQLDKNPWRGPVAVATDGYPTLTIASEEENVYRYSKDVLGALSSTCNTLEGTLGSSAWSCERLAVGGEAGDGFGVSADIAPSGEPWMTFYDDEAAGDQLIAMQYVKSGGNCDSFDATGGSDSWNCTVVMVHDNDEESDFNKIGFDNTGTPWIAFRNDEGADNDELAIAKYVGSGGNCQNWDGTGGSNAWQCTTIFQGTSNNDADRVEMAMSPAGVPWVTFKDEDGTVDAVAVAHYIGNGGNCQGFDNTGGSNEWQCERIMIGNDSADGDYPAIAFDDDGQPWIAFENYEGTAGGVAIAHFVGSGGNCDSFDVTGGSDAWQCELIVQGGEDGDGQYISLAFDHDGYPWVTLSSEEAAGNDLVVARYMGGTSGQNCDSYGTSGSDFWNCTTVLDGADNNDGDESSIAFDYNGNAWISFYEQNENDLMVANYVGSGGDCNSFGSGGGSTAWDCTVVMDGDNGIEGYYSELVFDHSGTLWVPHLGHNGTNNTINLARTYLPTHKPGAAIVAPNAFGSAHSGDLRYHLSAGLAPYTNPYGKCSSPTGDNNGYCGLFNPDGQRDSVSAAAHERPIYNFSTRFGSNSTLPTATLHFQTSVSPSTNNVVLQVYRYGSTNTWETVSTYSAAGCSSENCIIRALPTGTASDYFEADGSNYWVHYRVYQVESSSTGITFAVDSFTAEVPQKQLRGGRVFRELTSDPFGW